MPQSAPLPCTTLAWHDRVTSTDRFADASRVLAAARDIIAERPARSAPPAWCERRGWTDFLAALPPDVVLRAERDGLAAHVANLPDAPADLVALARAVTAITALPPVESAASAVVDPRRASPRKRAQVAAFAALVGRLDASPLRVVDLGSGHGHLTRHLAVALGRGGAGVGARRRPRGRRCVLAGDRGRALRHRRRPRRRGDAALDRPRGGAARRVGRAG